MSAHVDLKQLAVDRSVPSGRGLAPKRSWALRWGVPLAILTGFGCISGWSARDYWLPSRSVTVLPVVLSKSEVREEGTLLFQAAGWIEPSPTAVMCSALVEGVVEQLLVVEGQAVEVNEPVAKLVDAETRLLLREAESTLRLREAERGAAKANLAAARKNLEVPAHLEAAHADAEATLATLESDVKNLPFQIQAAKARQTLARQDLEAKKVLADSIAGRSIQKAQSEYDSATASFEELQQRGPNLNRQVDASRRKVDALHTKLNLKTEEHRAVDEATATYAATEARVEQAKLSVESAKLRLERMTVRSPIRGRVLALNAQPGRRLMGINAASERDASTVVTLYDPEKLQVRVDVRLEDVPQVQIGQPVQIVTAAEKQTLAGRVLVMTSQADIQKNTLQVKVSVDQPSAVLRPEMLAQVTFVSQAHPSDKSERSGDETSPVRILVPRELVERGDGGATVWIMDAARSTAVKRRVELGRVGTDQLVEVTQGISALDKLIVSGRDGLTEGTRLQIAGVDRQIGAGPSRVSTPTNVGKPTGNNTGN